MNIEFILHERMSVVHCKKSYYLCFSEKVDSDLITRVNSWDVLQIFFEFQ